MASLGFHFRDFLATKLSPHPRNSRLTCEGGVILDDQKKDLICQMVISEDLLQVVEREVFDLQGQIDTLNAAEVTNPTMKASLKKTEAYVKEPF